MLEESTFDHCWRENLRQDGLTPLTIPDFSYIYMYSHTDLNIIECRNIPFVVFYNIFKKVKSLQFNPTFRSVTVCQFIRFYLL